MTIVARFSKKDFAETLRVPSGMRLEFGVARSPVT
jgi:hypothetical protein